MKSLILVAVILQLVIIGIKTDKDYKFGDIIEFPRICPCLPVYSHFAIYVGPESGVNIGQGPGNDIFHRTGKRKGRLSDCKFDKLKDTRSIWKNDKKNNYLDEFIEAGSRTQEQISVHIREKIADCGEYGKLANNCEHLATYVRYGEALTLQKGTVAGCLLKKKMDTEKLAAIQKKYIEVRNRDSSRLEEIDENNNECPCENNLN